LSFPDFLGPFATRAANERTSIIVAQLARRLAQLFAIDHHREVVLSKRAAEREHMRVADRADVEAE